MLINKVNKCVTGTYKEDVKEEKKKKGMYFLYITLKTFRETNMSLLIPNFN